MNLQEKQQMAGDLSEKFSGAELAILVGYQGCKCEELTALRRQLRPAGAKMAVVKNTLVRRALTGTGREDLVKDLAGPTAVIWTGEDITTPAKAVLDFAKGNEKFVVKAGVLGDTVLDKKAVEALASLPSREELLAKLLALINAPATQLLRTINAPATQLVRLLGAWKAELEKKQ